MMALLTRHRDQSYDTDSWAVVAAERLLSLAMAIGLVRQGRDHVLQLNGNLSGDIRMWCPGGLLSIGWIGAINRLAAQDELRNALIREIAQHPSVRRERTLAETMIAGVSQVEEADLRRLAVA